MGSPYFKIKFIKFEYFIKKYRINNDEIDLRNGYVILPFGDAYTTHDLEGTFNLERENNAYLEEGTFYVQVLGNKSKGTYELRNKSAVIIGILKV